MFNILIIFILLYLCHLMTKPTKWHVHPVKTQINLGIRPVWSESFLSTWGKPRSLAIIRVHSQASYQAGRMPRLIWVFARHKCHFVGFVMRRLILLCLTCVNNTDFCYFAGSGISYQHNFWFLFPETPRESECFYVSMHVYACLRLLCHTADE